MKITDEVRKTLWLLLCYQVKVKKIERKWISDNMQAVIFYMREGTLKNMQALREAEIYFGK
jgi:hypothetical protein